MQCIAYTTHGNIFSLGGGERTNYRLDGKQAIFSKRGGDKGAGGGERVKIGEMGKRMKERKSGYFHNQNQDNEFMSRKRKTRLNLEKLKKVKKKISKE